MDNNRRNKDKNSGQIIKTCVNCRHLEVLEEGEDIKGLGDTAFIRTRCRMLDMVFTDHYAFPTGEERLDIDGKPAECPLWEPWDTDEP